MTQYSTIIGEAAGSKEIGRQVTGVIRIIIYSFFSNPRIRDRGSRRVRNIRNSLAGGP